MNRKIIKQSNQAMTLTLPIDWIRDNNLKAGDEVNITQNEKELIIKTNNKRKTGKLSLDGTSLDRRMQFIYLSAIYARGIDELKLKTNIYPELTQNLGYAVVKQKDSDLLIRDLTGANPENLDEIFKRVFQMTINFYETAVSEILKNKSFEKEIARNMDQEINKFTLFLQRQIIKQTYTDSVTGKVLFTYSFELEKIGDSIYRMWRETDNIKKTKDIANLLELVQESLIRTFNTYYSPEVKKIKESFKLRDKIRLKTNEIYCSNNARFLMHVIKIAEDCFDLTQLALMSKFKPE